jgi:serine/threonine-protein kinase
MPLSLDSLSQSLSGRYTVERVLGGGATATVFLGTEIATGRPVAIKVFRPEVAATVGPRRFLREIGLLQALDHPNILPLLASETAGSVLYYVSPYAAGGSLAARLAGPAPLSLEDAVAVASPVAAALDYAHAKDVVHRDVKPGNILFDGSRVVVCDFGIARAIDDSFTDRSSSGYVLGTPAYMSPEQARGISPADARSDVYALACVVYEMLAGEPPFTGPTLQAIVARQAREHPRRLGIVRPDVPPRVETAVERALAKDPLRRPRSAGAFVRALAG